MIAARAADAGTLAVLHAAAFPPGDAWGENAIAMMLEAPGGFGLWRPDAGLVLARVAADEAEILTLAVIPAARRAGLGAALMAAAMTAAAAQGARTMFLEVAEPNAAARGLYAGLGFNEAGRRRRYYASGADALVVRCDLNPSAIVK